MSKKNIENFLASEQEKDNINNPEETKAKEKTEEAKKEKSPEKKESKIKTILHSRKFSRGWLSVAVIAVFLACVVAVNVIASVLESKFPSLSFDITSTNMYELQEDTKKLCKSIDKDITIYLLSDEDTFTSFDNYYGVAFFTQANQFFKEIADLNSHIKFEYKDVASDPSFTTKYKRLSFTNNGSSVACIVDAGDDNYIGLAMNELFYFENDESTGSYMITKSTVEQAICTALLSLTKENTAKACFITSSGIMPESESTSGQSTYSGLKTLLKNQAFDVSAVDLDSKEDIPKDCDVVLFVAPTKDISDEALEKVNSYLNGTKDKNRTFVYIPAPYVPDDGTPNLDSFLEENGMKVENSWIYEENNKYITSMYSDDHTLSTFNYNNDDFIEGIDSSSKVLMAMTRPIVFTDNSTAVTMLDSSSDAGTIPLTAKSEDEVKKGNGKPISGAAINKGEVSEGVTKNVIVIGSYYAVSSTIMEGYAQYNNSAYFANIFNILTDNEGETITIESATASDTDLGLESASQAIIPSVIYLGILPIGVLILGIVVWAVRRKK